MDRDLEWGYLIQGIGRGFDSQNLNPLRTYFKEDDQLIEDRSLEPKGLGSLTWKSVLGKIVE